MLVVIDHFSKYVAILPLKNKGAITVHDALNDIVTTIGTGYLAVLHSDNGSEFCNEHVMR